MAATTGVPWRGIRCIMLESNPSSTACLIFFFSSSQLCQTSLNTCIYPTILQLLCLTRFFRSGWNEVRFCEIPIYQLGKKWVNVILTSLLIVQVVRWESKFTQRSVVSIVVLHNQGQHRTHLILPCSHTSIVKIGTMPSVIGFPAPRDKDTPRQDEAQLNQNMRAFHRAHQTSPVVLVTTNFWCFLSNPNHAHPDPNVVMAAFSISPINLSYDPKSFSILSASRPCGLPPPPGFMECQ